MRCHTPRKIRDRHGLLRTPPRIFFRGTTPSRTERIKTGWLFWDSLLFVTDNIKDALNYGSQIECIEAMPEACILYEGTREFRKIMSENYEYIAKQAAEIGYDAVWFKLQGTVGTAIINVKKFKRGCRISSCVY